MSSTNISAKTLDEAITKACLEFGVTSDQLEYEILDKGSRGFFGIGAKPCLIQAKIKGETTKEDRQGHEKKPKLKENKGSDEESFRKGEDEGYINLKERKTNKIYNEPEKNEEQIKEEGFKRKQRKINVKDKGEKQKRKVINKSNKKIDIEKNKIDFNQKKRIVEPEKNSEIFDEDPAKKSVAFLNSLFDAMGMEVDASGRFESETKEVFINLSGKDMDSLIGRRGQIMEALQYLTGQVVNKKITGHVWVRLDTENYRAKRKQSLEQYALEVAKKVKKNNRPMVLEPMNAYERRVIHSVLQPESDLSTHSEGEEPYRHIVVRPVKKAKDKSQSKDTENKREV